MSEKQTPAWMREANEQMRREVMGEPPDHPSPADAAREEGRKPVEFEDLLGSVEDAGDDFFRAFTSRPCNICGRRRNYRVDGQLQVVCHACANPQSPALPSAGEEERLREIEARVNAASRGPWRAVDLRHQRNGQIRIFPADEIFIANVLASGPQPAADAAFIAHAPDDVRWLLSRLRAAEQWATYWHAEWERTEKLFQETSRAALTRTPDPTPEGGPSNG